jgi:hypothetical protein
VSIEERFSEEGRVKDEEIAELRRALRTSQRQLIKAKDRGDQLRTALAEAARDAILTLGPLPPVNAPKIESKRGKPEVALLHTTDWQAAKITPSYNSGVLVDRLDLLRAKVAKLVKIHRSDRPVNECGDIIEGLFNYPAQLAQIDATLFEQWTFASTECAKLVRWALSVFDHVTVVPEWGNHGRIGSKRAEVPKSDNFDRMVYEHARLMLAGEKRLTWLDCPEGIQRIEIGAYRALLIHGDEIGRNGFASPMTIVRHANQWRSGAYPWEFRDVYVGHYHTHNEWAMANGEGTVYQTGSTESDNLYAREGMASSAIPSQRLHFIDPVKGLVTAQYKVILG